MTQPAAEQLLNLADRAECHGGLTPDEAQRLRNGVAHHCARAEKAEAKVKKQTVRIEEYRESRRRWMDAAYADRKTALEQQQRAEKAEAERDAWAAKAEERFQRVLKQSRVLQELKRDTFELRMDVISLLNGRLGDIGPNDIQPGAIRRAALDEQQEQPAAAAPRARCRCDHARDLHSGRNCAGCAQAGLGILANHAFIARKEQP